MERKKIKDLRQSTFAEATVDEESKKEKGESLNQDKRQKEKDKSEECGRLRRIATSRSAGLSMTVHSKMHSGWEGRVASPAPRDRNDGAGKVHWFWGMERRC